MSDQTIQVIHKGQHILKHKAKDIRYINDAVPTIKDSQEAIDQLFQLVSGINWRDSVATHADLPTVGNLINDARAVQDDDGIGTTAIYVCIATVGTIDQQWFKIAVINGPIVFFDGTATVGSIMKRTGQKTLGKVTEISAVLIVSAQTLATFTNTAGTQEKGSTLNSFSLNWTYNRNANNPFSQSIDHSVGTIATNLRTKAFTVAALTSDITYTISAVGDDVSHGAPAGNASSLQTTIPFLNRRYYGVSQNNSLTNGQILALGGTEFCSGKPVAKTFDASTGGGANHLYICYPASFGAPVTATFGGFAFTDYTVTTQSVTNASGFSESFYVVKTNQVYSGTGLVFAITS